VGRESLVVEAWQTLYPEKELPYEPSLGYSGRFVGLNANIRLSRNVLHVGMSKKWRTIDKAIQIGLIQHLLIRLKRDARKTTNIDLYHAFLKHAHIGVEKTESDPELEASFDKINEEYFVGMLERPNLVWSDGYQRLGFYDYGRDTIAISRVLRKDVRLLDYVMYHEMLHKKHKFASSGSRTIHHSRQFREDEAKFKDAPMLEKQLGRLGRSSWWE